MESTAQPTPEERLQAALKKITDAIPGATPAQKAFLYRRAGDVCVSMEERRRALPWYGRAIDQHLQLRDPEPASLLCRLIVHVQPDALRARGTLTWIAIGTREHEDAVQYLSEYVEAARRAGQNVIAAQQLRWMFAASGSRSVRELVVAALRTLGDAEHADLLARELDQEAPPQTRDREWLWQRVLEATVGPAR